MNFRQNSKQKLVTTCPKDSTFGSSPLNSVPCEPNTVQESRRWRIVLEKEGSDVLRELLQKSLMKTFCLTIQVFLCVCVFVFVFFGGGGVATQTLIRTDLSDSDTCSNSSTSWKCRAHSPASQNHWCINLTFLKTEINHFL